MSWLSDLFRPRVQVIERTVRVHDDDYQRGGTSYGGGRTKYGNLNYREAGYTDYAQQRENARGVYHDSLIARGIVGRLVDNVINTGLTLESSPLWSLIPGAPADDEARYQWTEQVENRFHLYTGSKESDYHGRMTFSQIQRLLYTLRIMEGEYFCILRYLNSPRRMSPLAIQVLNNDQVVQPFDSETLKAAKDRGARIYEGIEYDASGQMIAVYVAEKAGDFLSRKPTRIPVYGPKSGRRFVIHDANFDAAAQHRGFPELSAFIYELDRLTEYDITELEATIAGAIWFATIETEKGSPASAPIKPGVNLQDTTSVDSNLVEGPREVRIRNRALMMQNLKAGQSMKGFQPNRPNPNFAAFEEVFENRISTSLGMPLSAYRQKFQSSYSAARAEILFFWNNIVRRRDDFVSGLLSPFYESWVGEEIRSGNIKADGWNRPVERHAWMNCTWNGISRPVVDPVKEVNAVQTRQRLGHTTGEREAKAYNGSDFRENVKRLSTENQMIADANEPLDPAQYADPGQASGGSDREDGNG
jgi:lambda family phage portal protein